MGTFTTHISVRACLLPTSLVRFLNAQAEEGDLPYEANDQVEIEYNEGWSQSGNRSGHPDNWTPDEGEDCEILSVEIQVEDWKPEEGESSDLSGSFTRKEDEALRAECEEDQRQVADNWY